MRASWLWILVGVAAVGVAAWFMLPIPSQNPEWHVAVSDALLIGTPDNPTAYEGTETENVSGSGSVVIQNGHPSLSASVDVVSTAWLVLLGVVQSAPQRLTVELLATTTEWPAGSIYGDTTYGGNVLPTTTALLGGEGVFEIYGPAAPSSVVVSGTWSLAHAVRRSDGSVRQQGLYYSPLLRDKTGFSDSTRLEFTLMLNFPYGDGTVPFTVVFQTLDVLTAPGAVTLP